MIPAPSLPTHGERERASERPRMDAEDYDEKLRALDRTLTELQARRTDAEDAKGAESEEATQ